MTSYLTELEVIWQENAKKMRDIGPMPEGRTKRLRGPDFCRELIFFHLLTEDQRFKNAVEALFDHGLIDGNSNFTRWEFPPMKALEKNLELTRLRSIQERMAAGEPLHRACAEVAARTGHRPHSTFGAAIKDLELKFKKEAPNIQPAVDHEGLLLHEAVKTVKSLINSIGAHAAESAKPKT